MFFIIIQQADLERMPQKIKYLSQQSDLISSKFANNLGVKIE